ncbi:hypothetical protein [Arthrobacter roseus]|uniref:hypothetical protein n=1 Tax=Arthrobacter roseus TaxID=136274 RepID=UPI00196254AE|nr:hypothetical protein [Arthrobacter roseus]MBM7849586.1 type VI protein secretion system component VasK [Arthrobacter roseus]
MGTNPTDPKSLFDRLIGGCMSVLLASIAIYCAAQIIQSIWPVLVIVTGVVALVWIAVIVIRIWLSRRY